MIEITIGLLAAVVILTYWFLTDMFDYWQKRGVKFVKPLPIVGSIGRVATFREHITDFYCRVYKQFKDDKFVGFYRMRKPVLIFLDPELIKNVLIKDFSHFTDHGLKGNLSTEPMQARNLFMLGGQKWKEMRAKLTPTFTSGCMKSMFPLVLESTTRLEKLVEEIADSGEYVDIKNLLSRYTTDVIGSCAFGIDCDSINDPKNKFFVMSRHIFRVNWYSSFKRAMWLNAPQIFQLFRMSNTADEVNAYFRALVRDVIHTRINSGKTRRDFIQLLMEIRESSDFTDDDICGQALLFFIAGFHSSSTVLTFALFELARNPELQRTARLHIAEILERHDGKFTYESIQDMTYLDWIFQESLRKYPPGPMLFRICTKNYTIPGTNVLIDEGTHVEIPTHAIQNDPAHFSDPETFNPARFSDEKGENQKLFLAFGEGPRHCLGQRFARMQSKLALAMFLRSFEVEVNSKIKYPLAMNPRHYLMITKEVITLKITTVLK